MCVGDVLDLQSSEPSRCSVGFGRDQRDVAGHLLAELPDLFIDRALRAFESDPRLGECLFEPRERRTAPSIDVLDLGACPGLEIVRGRLHRHEHVVDRGSITFRLDTKPGTAFENVAVARSDLVDSLARSDSRIGRRGGECVDEGRGLALRRTQDLLQPAGGLGLNPVEQMRSERRRRRHRNPCERGFDVVAMTLESLLPLRLLPHGHFPIAPLGGTEAGLPSDLIGALSDRIDDFSSGRDLLRRPTPVVGETGPMAVTIYGVCAVTFMMVMYALEGRGRQFVLLFALGCVLSSAYGFLSGAWPFGVVELIWSGVAVRRYRELAPACRGLIAILRSHPRIREHDRYSRPVAYQSLYRKYRPQRFSELVGQEHVTTALQNALRDGRVGHAYLFSGPRGTGKTTTARLLAKALNCTNRGDDGDPCGVCDSCVAIAEGSSLDVIEVDAASKSRVEEMRDLLERVAYLSAGGAKKVYILDEVHMLSASAEAALLKTLEESPEHVVFVLATTDPLKVAPTIRSRTQHYEFSLYSLDEIVGHLADVCAKEGVDADREALAVIARAGAGSMRDSLSLLDQAIAHGRVDLEQVSVLFGGSAFDRRLAILGAVADEDVAGALVALGELLDAGHEPRRLTEDLLATVRDAFLLTSARGRVRVDLPDDAQDALRALGEQVGATMLVRTLETLGQAVVDMRGTDAADPRLVLEIALVRLARREAGTPLQALAERVDRLERGPAVANVAAPPADAS